MRRARVLQQTLKADSLWTERRDSTARPQCAVALCPPGLPAPVNGEAMSQKGENVEDKEQEDGQDAEEGLRRGSSEDLHNE